MITVGGEFIYNSEAELNTNTQTHKHPVCPLSLTSLQLMYSEVLWLFGANKLATDPAQVM